MFTKCFFLSLQESEKEIFKAFFINKNHVGNLLLTKVGHSNLKKNVLNFFFSQININTYQWEIASRVKQMTTTLIVLPHCLLPRVGECADKTLFWIPNLDQLNPIRAPFPPPCWLETWSGFRSSSPTFSHFPSHFPSQFYSISICFPAATVPFSHIVPKKWKGNFLSIFHFKKSCEQSFDN